MAIYRILFIVSLLSQCSAALFSLEERELEVIPNPHGQACTSRLNDFLEYYHLITKPMKTQQDTFKELVYRKVLQVPIPVYRMKQPQRLSDAQLEFQLVLVKDLAKAGKALIHETPVDRERALDSWFPGYYWTPLVMSCGDANSWQHVGWKFTAVDEESQTLKHFYALMVLIDEEETVRGIRIGGFRAPGWMVEAVVS